MARKVDLNLLNSLVEGSQGQVVQKGIPLTTDPNFPLFTTPVNQDVIVYIPRTNVVVTENGEDMRLLSSHIHTAKAGNFNRQIRCIHGLEGNPAFDAMGYDGSCPACEAMSEVWELYKMKLEAELKAIGLDPQNAPPELLKSTRTRLLEEMALKDSEEYVTFPVVLIPSEGLGKPKSDAMENMKAYFVHWRKKRYEEKLLSSLKVLMNPPSHPAGLLWQWQFTYNTGGKQPNARDSALNARYNVITDNQVLEIYKPFIMKAEEIAKDFTVLKAAEVVVANQFMYKEDMVEEVNKIMANTRKLIKDFKALTSLGVGNQSLGGQVGVQQALPNTGNPLMNFGQMGVQQGQQMGVQQGNLGMFVPPKN